MRHTAIPVSYTHLDVYKRPVWENGRETEREIEFFGREKLDAVELIRKEFGL